MLNPSQLRALFRSALVGVACLLMFSPGLCRADELRRTLDRPIRASLRVIDRSTPLRGEIVEWAYGAFWVVRDGGEQPVRIGWDEIEPDSVYETARRIVDRDSPVSYFRLGIGMLALDDEKLAQRAFDYAARLDDSIRPDTQAALKLWRTGADPMEAFVAMQTRAGADPVEQGVLGERDLEENRFQAPSAQDETQAKGGVAPWVPLSIEDRERAVAVQREFAATAGLGREDNKRILYETEHFIIGTELNEREAQRWGTQLETMYTAMLEMFALPDSTDLYAGKCNVFIFGGVHSYLKFEERAMGIDAKGTGGICHYRGEDVVIAFYRFGSETDFQSVLIHESVHGFLYRYQSPARIPTWVNEGLAEYIAGVLTPGSNNPRSQWSRAKNFVNLRKDPHDVIENFYARADRSVYESYALSHMLIRFLIKYKPVEFKLWLDDMKSGVDWERAMRDRFGIDARTLAKGFADEIRSESSYSRDP